MYTQKSTGSSHAQGLEHQGKVEIFNQLKKFLFLLTPKWTQHGKELPQNHNPTRQIEGPKFKNIYLDVSVRNESKWTDFEAADLIPNSKSFGYQGWFSSKFGIRFGSFKLFSHEIYNMKVFLQHL